MDHRQRQLYDLAWRAKDLHASPSMSTTSSGETISIDEPQDNGDCRGASFKGSRLQRRALSRRETQEVRTGASASRKEAAHYRRHVTLMYISIRRPNINSTHL